MSEEDNGTAVLRDSGTGADIINFPGIEEREETFTGVRQRGAIDGEVVRIGGVQKWIPIMLRSEGETITNCYCKQTFDDTLPARQIADALIAWADWAEKMREEAGDGWPEPAKEKER